MGIYWPIGVIGPNMRKILHLRSSSIFAGPERQILQLAKSMEAEGFQLEIVALYRRKGAMPPIHPLLKEAKKIGLRAEQLNDRGKFSLKTVSSITDKLKEEHFSLIHTHGYKANLIGGMAAKLAGIKCIATVHLHTQANLRLKLYRLIDLFALRFFSKIIAVCENLRQEMISAGLSENKIVTIHNAVDLKDFSPNTFCNVQQIEDQLGIEANQPIVSIIGRLSPQKGHRYFLEAAARVLKALPESRFLIIGDGPLKRHLEEFATSLGIGGAVSFLGYREDIVDLMRLSDVIVISSIREGLPYVLLEALALAKPVVATRVGGVPEVVKDKVTGFLVPPQDAKALAEAVIHLLSDRKEAKRVGEEGRELIYRKFSVQTMARRIAEVYREVLAVP